MCSCLYFIYIAYTRYGENGNGNENNGDGDVDNDDNGNTSSSDDSDNSDDNGESKEKGNKDGNNVYTIKTGKYYLYNFLLLWLFPFQIEFTNFSTFSIMHISDDVVKFENVFYNILWSSHTLSNQ